MCLNLERDVNAEVETCVSRHQVAQAMNVNCGQSPLSTRSSRPLRHVFAPKNELDQRIWEAILDHSPGAMTQIDGGKGRHLKVFRPQPQKDQQVI